MQEINSSVLRRMKLRKTLMIIFSVCTVMLICGICNYVMESGNGTDNITETDSAPYSGSAAIKNASRAKVNPREMIMDRKDKKIRLYSAIAFLSMMAGSIILDLFFVRCPFCSKHISYSINPSFCHHCGKSFACKE